MFSILVFVTGINWVPGDIHEEREWRFKNGGSEKMAFVNVYGSTVYFYRDKHPVSANIVKLEESAQGEIVLWSRERDRMILNGETEPSEFTKQFRKDAQALVNGKLVDTDWSGSREPDFYAIYFSASWCGPCRQFTPSLVTFYNTYKVIYGDRFELILCSWDESKGSMIKYMEEEKMPWLGNWSRRNTGFWRNFQGSGIPCLVIVDRNGFPISHSYNGSEYLGPRKPLGELKKLLLSISGDANHRVSVPTPGVDVSKMSDAIRGRVNKVRKTKTDFGPLPVLTPLGILAAFDDPDCPKTIIKVRVALDNRGIVREARLLNAGDPSLETAIRRQLSLWQFMPKITASEGAIPSEVVLPITLRVKTGDGSTSKELAKG